MGELLRDALRYEYGPAGSRDFFNECNSRLSTIKAYSEAVEPTAHAEIRTYARELSHLSRLIAHIERSHIGEFPWAFAGNLKHLAESLLVEKDLDRAKQLQKSGQPLFFIMAEGGLSAFEARRDVAHPSYCKRRICTIVVPRSLKHHVLLHTILGHEVCHSATWSDKVAEELTVASGSLESISALTDSEKLLEWAGECCPGLLPKLTLKADEARRRWLRELLCDLIGLLTMGPSYFAAMRTMLGLTDPTGAHIDNSHPPHVWRFQLLEYAYREMGWDKPMPASVPANVRKAYAEFNNALLTYNHKEMKADKVISKAHVVIATRKLRDWLKSKGDFSYNYPLVKPQALGLLLDDLKALRPPIGQRVTEKTVSHARPDFRQILHVGWIACHAGIGDGWPTEDQDKVFTIVNRLCDQAMVQNLALDTGFAPEADAPVPGTPGGGKKAARKAAKKAKKKARKAAKKERNRAGTKS